MKKRTMFTRSGLAYIPCTVDAWILLFVYVFFLVGLIFLIGMISPPRMVKFLQIAIFLVFYFAALRFAKTRST